MEAWGSVKSFDARRRKRAVTEEPNASILYLHSQRFVQNMVKALQSGIMDQFMKLSKSRRLLIDDIQFFGEENEVSRRVFPCLQRFARKEQADGADER